MLREARNEAARVPEPGFALRIDELSRIETVGLPSEAEPRMATANINTARTAQIEMSPMASGRRAIGAGRAPGACEAGSG